MTQFIPKGYNQVMPYLILKDASRFIEFTKNVFGATLKLKEMRDEHTIMHGEVVIGESCIMFADATDQFEPMTSGMFIYVENTDEVYNKAIASDASIVMELSDQEYGRTCGVQDPCGNTWWITSVKIQ